MIKENIRLHRFILTLLNTRKSTVELNSQVHTTNVGVFRLVTTQRAYHPTI